MMDERAEKYLTRRIGEIKRIEDHKQRSLAKSTFMLECSTFAEAGFMTHDERFAFTERMLEET
jgi:hypothetical protein